MNRRNFLVQSLAAGLSLRSATSLVAADATSAAPLFNISLAEWSLHRTIRSGELAHLDFAKAARRDYGLDAVEYVNGFFKDKASDRSFLSEMKQRAADEGVRSLLIMIDAEGALGDADAAKRTQAVENHYKWVEAARFLGCHSIRVNAETNGATPDEQMKLAADGLSRLAEFGAEHQIDVIVENHGGISSNAAWLAGVMKLANHPRLGTLPDFGNFRITSSPETWYDRYQGVAEMMPFARAVSAKSHDFDARGNEIHTDFARMMKIVLAHGYRGYVGIEYEGDVLREPDGIRATRDLLLRVREQLGREA